LRHWGKMLIGLSILRVFSKGLTNLREGEKAISSPK